MRVVGLHAFLPTFPKVADPERTSHLQSDLHMVIGANRDLTPDHHKVFLFQLLRGINYMHLSGVLHRDLKVGHPTPAPYPCTLPPGSACLLEPRTNCGHTR